MRRWVKANSASRDQSGFTLLELVIVIILVILLFMTAWWRLLPLRGDAEAAHVATTIGTLRSALGLEVTERIVQDSLEKAATLEAVNPMNLLSRAPLNYTGEVESAAEPEIGAGDWYFHLGERQLRYRVRFPQYLHDPTLEKPVDLSWEVRLAYLDRNDNDSFDAGVDSLRGIALEALDNPRWQVADKSVNEVTAQP